MRIIILAFAVLTIVGCSENQNVYDDEFYNQKYYDEALPRLPLLKPYFLIKLNDNWGLITGKPVNGIKYYENTIFLEKVKEVFVDGDNVYFKCSRGDKIIVDQRTDMYFVIEGDSLFPIDENRFSSIADKMLDVDELWKKFKESGILLWKE